MIKANKGNKGADKRRQSDRKPRSIPVRTADAISILVGGDPADILVRFTNGDTDARWTSERVARHQIIFGDGLELPGLTEIQAARIGESRAKIIETEFESIRALHEGGVLETRPAAGMPDGFVECIRAKVRR